MRSSVLPALVAVVATTIPLGATTPVGAASAPASSAPAAADEADPLEVEIDSLSPSYVPEKGKLRMTGTVTNVSDERWRAINVHPFIGDTPLTSSAELAETATTPVAAPVGDRIYTPGTFDSIGSLAPGEAERFTIELRRDQLPVSLPGAYWFGAHALGNTTEARDLVADGRARTLLPLVPSETRGRERAAVVVPIRRAIRHAKDGRIRAARRWATDLGADGRLSELTDFGAAAGDLPVTWLVDPAVPDAVSRLVEGNLPRTLADTTTPPGGQEGPDDDASPSAEIVDPDEEETGPPIPGNVAAEPGAAWLDRLETALAGDQVLTLPYGDPDVAATAHHAPELYDTALGRRGSMFQRWRIRSQPAVAAPDGFLSQDSLSVLTGDETVLLSDAALEDGEVRTSGRLGDQRLLFSSAATAQGGPGPGDPLSDIALRQRLLAEAAVRLLFHDRTPLLTVLPSDFAPDSAFTFWSGLDVPWLELTDTDDLGQGRPVDPADLRYPVEQELTELDAENFTAAEDLIAAGQALDTLLPLNDRVAGQVLDEALTSLSYTERDRALESRRDSLDSTEWIDRRLGRVRIRAPRGVTLSSGLGSFAPTVTNRLDQPVTIVLRTTSLGDVEVEDSATIELAPGTRQTVLLKTTTGAPGVHYVRVMVTDEAGHPLGSSQRVAIRSAQVSGVIWLILGVGVGLLFVAIALRVVRRVRRERG